MPGLLRLGECCGSIPGSNRPAELVVHPDPQHVVRDTRAIATVEEAAAKGGERRQVVSGNLAEINIEIFELGCPVASECAFDAGSDSPADIGAGIGECGGKENDSAVLGCG